MNDDPIDRRLAGCMGCMTFITCVVAALWLLSWLVVR